MGIRAKGDDQEGGGKMQAVTGDAWHGRDFLGGGASLRGLVENWHRCGPCRIQGDCLPPCVGSWAAPRVDSRKTNLTNDPPTQLYSLLYAFFILFLGDWLWGQRAISSYRPLKCNVWVHASRRIFWGSCFFHPVYVIPLPKFLTSEDLTHCSPYFS